MMKLNVLSAFALLTIGVAPSAAKPPIHLGKGVGISYVFGENGWVLKNATPSMSAFSAARLTAMTPASDFAWLAAQGFDHVRIEIEPALLGCTGAGGDFSVHPELSDVGARFEALYGAYDRAVANGLNVIFDIHPGLWNPDGGDTPFNDPGHNPPYVWSWVTKQQLCWQTATPSALSPLPLFWGSLAAAFADSGRLSPKHAAFEIMNEPLVGASYLTLDITEANFNSNVGFVHQLWRPLQKQAVMAVQSQLPDYGIIVTNTYSSPQHLGSYTVGPAQSPTTIDMFKAYDSDEVAFADNLIYTVHPYQPFRYTHWVSNVDNCWFFPYMTQNYAPNGATVDPKYRFDRDFYEEFHLPLPSGFDPEGLGKPEDLRSIIRHDLSMEAMFTVVNGWRYTNGMPPMIFTEIGAHRRDSVTINGTDLPPTDPGSPTNGEPGGGVINGNPDPELPGIRDMIMRARWHYDLRTNAENAGIGWTVFTYIGGFGIREGSIHGNLPNNGGTDYLHPGWRSTMFPYLSDGLFGDDRP